MIEKFTDFVNESASESLADIKRKIYTVAKTDYMNAVEKELKAHGIKVIKKSKGDSTLSSDVYDDYSNDYFLCSYKGSKDFKIKMSIKGVSLAPDLKDISGSYSTKISALVKKIEAVI